MAHEAVEKEAVGKSGKVQVTIMLCVHQPELCTLSASHSAYSSSYM